MFLIKKPYAVGDVVSVKLINGDELIGTLDEETDVLIKLDRPKALTLQAGGLGMIPWMLLGEGDKVTFSKTHVLALMMSNKDAASQYTQGITGIALS